MCLKLAIEHFSKESILGLFCDTQFEHPFTYQHIHKMRQLYGVRIETITAGSVPDMIRKYRRFPNGAQRFCTEELKIWPSKRFYKNLAETQGHGFEVWYGMRLAESHERARRYSGKIDSEIYPPHEFMRKYPKYLHKLGVGFRLPILQLSAEAVLKFLNGEENPLYNTFDRVGCFPCQAAGDGPKMKAYNYDEFGENQLKIIRILEKETGRSSFKKSGPGCSICEI